MSERIPQSVAKLVVFRAFLASDHVTPATGKTIAITISKNGATSFSNPAAGATNATEMASGFYKVSLGTGDTDTVGPLAYRGAEGTIDDVGDVFVVVNATNAGFSALPNAAADAAGGLPISDAGGLDLDAKLANTNEVTSARMGALTDWIDGGRLDLILDARASQASVNTIDDFLDTEITALLTDTGTDIPALIAALNNLSAAQVNAEVVDALNVDTYAQPGQGAPAATTTMRLMLAYLYKWARNKRDNDGTTSQFYNDDATTVDHKQATSESAGTVTVGEMATGP